MSEGALADGVGEEFDLLLEELSGDRFDDSFIVGVIEVAVAVLMQLAGAAHEVGPQLVGEFP